MNIRAIVPDTASEVLPSALFSSPHAQPVSFFAAGAEIYGQGEQAAFLYRVEFGAVRVYRLLADGRRQISAFHLAGEVFGFDSDGAHHFFAEAICATGVKAIRRSAQTAFSQDLLRLALSGLVRAQEHLLLLGLQTAPQRVAAFLLAMDERQGGSRLVELPMSRADIGDFLGLTIETVSRVFTKLRTSGIIILTSARTVEIRDFRTLHALSE